MNPIKLPLALFGFFGFVAVVPVWIYFVQQYSGNLSPESQFISQLVLPATVLLFLASWLQPRG